MDYLSGSNSSCGKNVKEFYFIILSAAEVLRNKLYCDLCSVARESVFNGISYLDTNQPLHIFVSKVYGWILNLKINYLRIQY